MASKPIAIVTWLWKSTGWRQGYDWRHVNALQRMVSKHLTVPHRFICITDMPDERMTCDVVPLWERPVQLFGRVPNCYARLKAFDADFGKIIGGKHNHFISLDLDVVIRGNIDHLVKPILDGSTSFKIMEGKCCPYNGSMWGMRIGAHKEVWRDFDPDTSPAEARQQLNKEGKAFYGSDQAWISHKLRNMPTWGELDGVYQYHTGVRPYRGLIPANAAIVFFAGGVKPWDSSLASDCPELYNEYMESYGV